MDERALFSEGHTAAQGCSQTNHLCHQGLCSQVLLENNAPQDGLHLRDAGADGLRRHHVDESGTKQYQADWERHPGEKPQKNLILCNNLIKLVSEVLQLMYA